MIRKLFSPCTWLLAVLLLGGTTGTLAAADEEQPRKPVNEVQPVYPDLARQMRLTGVVKVKVVIDAAGKVVSAQEIGGSPVLIPSALMAAKKWRFEPGSHTSTQILEFRFVQPGQ